MLLMFMAIMSIGNVWGQTFNGSLKATAITENKYIQWSQTSAQFSIADLPTKLGVTMDVLKDSYYIKWYIEDETGVKQNLSFGAWQQTNWSIAVKDNPWPYSKDSDASPTLIYLHQGINFWNGDNLKTKWTDWNLCQPTIYAPSGGTFETYKDYKIICVASKDSPTLNIYNSAQMEAEPDFVGLLSVLMSSLEHSPVQKRLCLTKWLQGLQRPQQSTCQVCCLSCQMYNMPASI